MRHLTFVEIDIPTFVDESPEELVTLRFAIDSAYLPESGIEAIASLQSVNLSPATISLGEDLGQRATLTCVFRDHRHVFNGEPFDQGTFWGKFRGRYGNKLRGRDIRWIQGLLGQSLEEMETRHYVIESIDGPDPQSSAFTITAKDVLKLADNDRAQAPRLSNGFLVSSANTSITSVTLSPSGIGDFEYPASGYVAIGGEEICAFTRSGDDLTLTRAQLGTLASEHEAQDRVQLVLRYVGEDPSDIIRDLFENYAGIDASYIPIEAWQTETGTFLQRLYSATIAEPTGVNKLVSELVEQAALAIWWDDRERLIRLQVLRGIPTTAAQFTADNTLEGSLRTKEQPTKRISQAWTYYAMKNPLEPVDEPDNYRSALATVALDSEDDYGGASIKKIFSRWIPVGGRSVAERLNNLQLGRFKDPPRRFDFEVFKHGPDEVQLGGGYRLGWWGNQAANGMPVLAPIQAVRLNPQSDRYVVEAEEMLFTQFDPADLVDRVIILDGDLNNANLREIHDGLFPDPTGTESPSITVTCIVEQNVRVGSISTALPAFDVGDWPVGIPITVRVLGRIQGAGGMGGGDGDLDGQAGGPAFKTRYPTTLDVDGGEVWGGGGGGGAGATAQGVRLGGGGGAGRIPGSGGTGGTNGQPGTNEAGGDGASLLFTGAGDGGDPGEAGEDGGTSTHGDGGQAGAAIDGESDVTVINSPEGDIRGPRIN